MSTNSKSKRTAHDLEFKKPAVPPLKTSGRLLSRVARDALAVA